jgi:UDP-N-acetylbacillosamine N-acetyltransferase
MLKRAKSKLLIWGAGGHARVVADIANLLRMFEIGAYLDDVNPSPRPSGISDAPVLGGREKLKALRRAGIRHAVVAIGSCSARMERAEILTDQGFKLVTLVHPRATIANDVDLGEGTVVAAGAIVNPGARVGDNVILNMGCTVDHDCQIGSGAHVCPGVHIAGNSVVGSGTWIGIGSTIIEKVRIGAGTFLGAGSLVLRDLPDNVLAYGRPAVVVSRLR